MHATCAAGGRRVTLMDKPLRLVVVVADDSGGENRYLFEIDADGKLRRPGASSLDASERVTPYHASSVLGVCIPLYVVVEVDE